jgi:hypothetical protein
MDKGKMSIEGILEDLWEDGRLFQIQGYNRTRIISISQATAQIKAVILEKLPKKLNLWFPYTGIKEEREHYKTGFNDALEQVKRIVEGL